MVIGARPGCRLDAPAGVPSQSVDAASESVVAGVSAAQQLAGDAAVRLLDAVRDSFTSGLHVVALICAAVFVALAALATAALRHVPPAARTGAGKESADADAATVGT